MENLFGKVLNNKMENGSLFEIVFQPKGTNKIGPVFVWALNRLDAHNFLIRNKAWGRQLSISYHGSNLLR